MKLAHSTSFIYPGSLRPVASRRTDIGPTCQRTEPKFSGTIRQQVYNESWEWLRDNAQKTYDYLYQQVSETLAGIRPLTVDTPKPPDIEAPPVIPALRRESPLPKRNHHEVELTSIRVVHP